MNNRNNIKKYNDLAIIVSTRRLIISYNINNNATDFINKNNILLLLYYSTYIYSQLIIKPNKQIH